MSPGWFLLEEYDAQWWNSRFSSMSKDATAQTQNIRDFVHKNFIPEPGTFSFFLQELGANFSSAVGFLLFLIQKRSLLWG